LVCGLVQAEEPKYTPAYTACQEKSGGADAAMLACIKAEYQIQDQKLNESYRELSAALSGSARTALKTAQRDWLKSRKGTCDFHYKVAGGSMAALVVQSCYLESTAERVERLNYWKSLKAG
jgi:uncharacterized protein YecT (DUF1311 family)